MVIILELFLFSIAISFFILIESSFVFVRSYFCFVVFGALEPHLDQVQILCLIFEGILRFTSFSISFKYCFSSIHTNDIASPFAPARPVLPIL